MLYSLDCSRKALIISFLDSKKEMKSFETRGRVIHTHTHTHTRVLQNSKIGGQCSPSIREGWCQAR